MLRLIIQLIKSTPFSKSNIPFFELPLESVDRLCQVDYRVGIRSLIHNRQILDLTIPQAVNEIRMPARRIKGLHFLVRGMTVVPPVLHLFLLQRILKTDDALLIARAEFLCEI